MITIRRVLFIVLACCTTYPCASLAAEEIKNPSPDERFALRIIDEQKVELIEKMSRRVMVDLGLCRESGATCTAEVRFTLAFDAQHHASVKKVGKTKTEVSE